MLHLVPGVFCFALHLMSRVFDLGLGLISPLLDLMLGTPYCTAHLTLYLVFIHDFALLFWFFSFSLEFPSDTPNANNQGITNSIPDLILTLGADGGPSSTLHYKFPERAKTFGKSDVPHQRKLQAGANRFFSAAVCG